MPQYRLREWNEDNSPMDVKYVQQGYAKRLWSKVSNYVRLYALHEEGGLYLDTDIEAVRNFDPLMDGDCFLGFQQRSEGSDWVNTAVMGSIPGHSFLTRCMNVTVEGFNRNRRFDRSPEVATRVLRAMGLREYGLQTIGGVRIFPVEYFYPYPYWEVFDPACVKEDTYCIHYWEGTWVKTKQGTFKLFLPWVRKLRSLKSRLNARNGLHRRAINRNGTGNPEQL
jgi:mannosyltransferase OCH1-like enzyme